MNVLQQIEKKYLRQDIPEFRAGDTVRVHVQIREGEKTRIQPFEGICLRRHNAGAQSTFTVRKRGAGGIGVERIFPTHSPLIKEIEVVRTGRVRQARIYYMRQRSGKAARIRERGQFR
ncbi:50S ribosomal protein L19 [Myxococcota bacterium]|nr:50S ribosomal protein L19 [Myxococcota bacterium]MBU1432799.1 50S ribosomal protein L19 [Myxococcota bacterium]MBU1897296.1 50S ribosomal protein L19 [Myxococcota bacterium]